MSRCKITTHVLDTARGCPAAGIKVLLDVRGQDGWEEMSKGVTDQDGRITDLLPHDQEIDPGLYRLSFETASYFTSQEITGFYPYIAIVFEVEDPSLHFHVPLLLCPYGYSTYRGS